MYLRKKKKPHTQDEGIGGKLKRSMELQTSKVSRKHKMTKKEKEKGGHGYRNHTK